jgi:hypothetical protein
VVKTYAQSLRELIGSSSVMEKKAFLRSFVQRIDFGDNDVKITYTMPMLPERSPTEDVAVLPFAQDGPPYWTQTVADDAPKRSVALSLEQETSTRREVRKSS